MYLWHGILKNLFLKVQRHIPDRILLRVFAVPCVMETLFRFLCIRRSWFCYAPPEIIFNIHLKRYKFIYPLSNFRAKLKHLTIQNVITRKTLQNISLTITEILFRRRRKIFFSLAFPSDRTWAHFRITFL